MTDFLTFLDRPDPLSAIASTGASLRTSSETFTRSVTANGMTVPAGKTFTKVHTWTLPHPTGIRASFSREGLKHSVLKLFKSEMQVGDPTFDKLVYISTETRDQTARLVAAESVQVAILAFVGTGGDVTIDDDVVTLRVRDDVDDSVEPDPREEAILLAHLLACA